MTKPIKLHNDVYEDLTLIRRDKEGETYSEAVARLIKLFHMWEKVIHNVRGA